MRGSGIQRLLVVGFAVVLVACGGPGASNAPTASPALGPSAPPATTAATAAPTALPPSPTPVATETPDPGATASTHQTFPEFGWVNRFVSRVVVSDLNVRRMPSKGAISDGKAPKDGLFMMYDWPIRADGYTWYYGFTLLTAKPGVVPDLPTPIETGYDDVLGGWMATGTEASPFLVPLAPRCPTTRDLLNVAAMLNSELVSCFGSASIELEGTFGCGGCGGVVEGSFEPGWLAARPEFDRLAVDDEGALLFALHFPPDGPAKPAPGSIIRVRGHFSDARATTCRVTEVGPDGEPSAVIANAAAAQWCRSRFVVDSYEVIGSGPPPVG
jgi:hypothetical protein